MLWLLTVPFTWFRFPLWSLACLDFHFDHLPWERPFGQAAPRQSGCCSCWLLLIMSECYSHQACMWPLLLAVHAQVVGCVTNSHCFTNLSCQWTIKISSDHHAIMGWCVAVWVGLHGVSPQHRVWVFLFQGSHVLFASAVYIKMKTGHAIHSGIVNVAILLNTI